MKCKTCVTEGKTSRVYGGGGWRTAMHWSPYWDEEGVYHSHDPNHTEAGYRCSEGHEWFARRKTPCPAPDCDYGKEKDDEG